jgi:hypothetical protein
LFSKRALLNSGKEEEEQNRILAQESARVLAQRVYCARIAQPALLGVKRQRKMNLCREGQVLEAKVGNPRISKVNEYFFSFFFSIQLTIWVGSSPSSPSESEESPSTFIT